MMYNIDQLTLLSGVDLPIPELKVNIHQPTLREIAYIGERSFYQAVTLLLLDKEDLAMKEGMTDEDKAFLLSQSNFQILMSIINSEGADLQKISIMTLLSLILPTHSIEIEERFILLSSSKGDISILDENSFDHLQYIVRKIFGLEGSGSEEFNPVGDKAREIAEKIKRGRAKVAALKGENGEQETSILSRYISGLSIGTNSLDINKLLDLTLYQLFDQLERYGLYTAYDMSVKAKMAGAKDVEDVDWLKNIH